MSPGELVGSLTVQGRISQTCVIVRLRAIPGEVIIVTNFLLISGSEMAQPCHGFCPYLNFWYFVHQGYIYFFFAWILIL